VTLWGFAICGLILFVICGLKTSASPQINNFSFYKYSIVSVFEKKEIKD
jgi:hypothetical protein